MSPRKVTLIPGDLIGRDLAGPVTDLVAAAGGDVDWEWIESSPGQLAEAAVDSIRRTGVALKGALSTGPRFESPSVALRKALGLYAGVRHVRNLAGLPARYENVDLVVIRENTEDVYAGLEHEVHPGVVESLKIVTRTASERIFRYAYRYARTHARKKVAIVHKANIMKKADGLFLQVGREIGAQNPDFETRDIIVDNACMQLVQKPHQFEVLVCGNLYGDILSDLSAGLVGGISAVWGMDQGDDFVVFDSIHGRVPHLLGKDVANPVPLLMPAVQLLDHIGQHEASVRLARAIEKVLVAKTHLTADLGGKSSTREMIAALKDAL